MQSELSPTGSDQSVDDLRRELAEAREQQTATSEILRVISKSTDLQAVFDAILRSAVNLCDAEIAAMFPYDGKLVHLGATHNWPKEAIEYFSRVYPSPPSMELMSGRTVLSASVVKLPDAAADPHYDPRSTTTGLWRRMLGVPIMRESRVLGALVVCWRAPGETPQQQIDLLQTFADQAVIAIENTRLFEEVQEKNRALTETNAQLTNAVEQQTATADVLKAISRSTFDLKKVLDTLVQSAVRLCDANKAFLVPIEGTTISWGATHGFSLEYKELLKRHVPLAGRGTMSGRVALEHAPVQISDVLADPEFTWSEAQKLGNYRTLLGVPLLRDGILIGVLGLARDMVRPFTDKQIELVTTFADQAVIAIENTRLFEEVQARTRELQDSLEYQTAIGEVLSVISRSKFHLQPVLNTIAATATRLCLADMATIRRQEADGYISLATHGMSEEHAEYSRSLRHEPGRGSIVGRVLLEGRSVQITDVLADSEYRLNELQRRGNFRTILGVPLQRAGVHIGVIAVMRRAVEPFSQKQIELVETFADQAVIAIENTRLFDEVQARTRELAQTVEDLEIASQHKSQFVANMSHELRTPLAAILGYAELIQEGFYGPQPEKSMDALTRIRSNGRHLLGLINTVLDVAKIESGQFSLNLAEYALSSVVETARVATESLAETKKIALMTHVPKSLPIGFGDEQRLTQVLLNLVGNAIKFTDTGEVRITAKAENGHFTVSVADTGPGIPADQLTRVFDQFHQVDNSNTKAKGGTGLGLAISKQIVEMHGGRVWAESEPGKGATFLMQLPVRAESRKTVQ